MQYKYIRQIRRLKCEIMSEKIIEKKNKQMNMKYWISEWTSSYFDYEV